LLGLTEVIVRDLQLTVLIRRRKCTTVEKSILLLELLKLMRNGGVVLIVWGQTHTLLHDSPGSVILQVEQVLWILGHRSHASTEVRALEVRYGLKALLPHGIFLIPNQEKRDRHHSEVTLTQWGECDVGRLLDGSVGLAVDVGPHPQIHLVEGYCHACLAYVQAIGHRQAAAVDRDFSIVAETEECVIKHSWEPRAMLAHGTKSPILVEKEEGVIVQVHLKT
jgi:hypothetical protein